MATKRKEMVDAVPRREMRLFDEMDRMFDTLLHRGWLRPFGELLPDWAPFATAEFMTPRVDVIDREEETLVRAELPGVEKQDLEVDLSGGLLTIKGERHHDEKTEKGDFYRAEIGRGTFSRTLRLPEEVDFEKAEAVFKDGMLEVRLPKTHATKRRHIEIR